MNFRKLLLTVLWVSLIAGAMLDAVAQRSGANSPKTKTAAPESTVAPGKKPPKTISWIKDLETAKRLSAKDGRPVIAYFTFNGCVWCKVLEDKTMSDQGVAEVAKNLIWVYVNRDYEPDIPKRFNVSAYPSLIVLGTNEENVHRFQSYIKPDAFISELKDGLKRYALYKKGEKWDTTAERAPRLTSEASYDTIKAPFDAATNHAKGEFPSGGVPAGITFLNGEMWTKQLGGKLFKLDAGSGNVKLSFDKLPFVTDICADGQVLYAVASGWTAGHPIYVIEPTTGQILREIVTEENKKNKAHGARGITYLNGKLYVLGLEGLSEVDPQTGEITKLIVLEEKGLTGLDFDGKYFVAGSRTHLIFLDPDTGKTVRKIAVNYPLRTVAYHEESFYLMEQPVFGYDSNNRTIQLWPKPGDTVIYRVRLTSDE